MTEPLTETSRVPSLLRTGPVIQWYDHMVAWCDDWRERRRFARRSLPAQARRVLLIRDRGLGDVLQVSTIFDAIRSRYGAEELVLATSDMARSLFSCDARLDRVMTTEEDCFDCTYDLYINLHIFDNSPSAKRFVALVPTRKLLGRSYADPEKESWLEKLAGSCWLRKYCRIADVPFDPQLPLQIRIPKPPEWEEQAALCRRRYLPGEEPNLAVCLGGMDWRRNYSIAYLDNLLGVLKGEYPLLLLGLRQDRPTQEQQELDNLLARHPDVCNLIDRLTLHEYLYILESCGALVTCDTGPVHMAIGLGVPLIALFGHTPGTQLLGPLLKSNTHAVLTPESGCRYCGVRVRPECQKSEQARCMDHIAPGAVLQAVRERFHTGMEQQ